MLKLMNYLDRKLQQHRTDDEGATMVEYALVVSLIAIAAIVAVEAVGGGVTDAFQAIADAL